ncbi:MAG: hypothetical protein ACE5ET_05670, partial [Gammaproteobacteria bacterium]
GQYIVDGDRTSTAAQSFYGIWDHGKKSIGRSDLLAQPLSTVTTSTRVTTDVAVDYKTQDGWYIDLTSGERVAVNPKIRGEYVFFNTLIPATAACSFGGSGWLMAVRQVNGGTPEDPVFDVNNDFLVNDADLVDDGGTNKAPAGIKFGEGLPAESNFLGDNQYTPGSTGNLVQKSVDTGQLIDEGRLSWQELQSN